MDEENTRPSDPMSSAGKTARLCADVARKIEAISDDRGRLAILRRGAGLSPGEAPEAWGVLLESFPEELMEKRGAGGRYETAEYIALTSYALSMQGSNRVQPPKDVSIGKACGMFADSTEDPVKKRFDRLVLSTDTTDLAGRLAGMIRLLKGKGIQIDYVLLARQLVDWQNENRREAVVMNWFRDFYRELNKKESESK